MKTKKDREKDIYKSNPDQFYSRNFFNRMQNTRAWQKSLGKIVCNLFDIKSVVDFGCASGFYLEGFYEAGSKILGYEYMLKNSQRFIVGEIRPFIKQGNVMEPIDCGKFDLSMSIEVAEHILPEKSDELVNNLVNASNKYILFTGAPPEQRGVGHINEQPREFWVDKIEAQGFKVSEESIKKYQDAFIDVPSDSAYAMLIKRQAIIFIKEGINNEPTYQA